MSKTPIPFNHVSLATALASAGSADVDKVHNYVLVTDAKGYLHHMEQHTGKYTSSGSTVTVTNAVTMLRNDATD
jgi:hypothetical protein